ncbi:MAG: transcriptional repressor [Proteiniphilum sp.]|nr:transcriptional repressor [Proteiniphilum sp.]
MDAKYIEEILHHRDIRPTAIRMLVLKAMLSYGAAFSLSDLEREMGTVDKSTLSRTINLFHQQHLIHSIDDGSGSIKYSVCSDDCQCSLGDLHVHFHCTKCGNTYCMESISIPDIPLPPDFRLENVNFVMKGICAQCAR